LQEGEVDGVEAEKYHWLVTISPLLINIDNQQNNTATSLFKVKVQVSWGNDDDDQARTIELNSLKSL
jgi:hypothetical protein